MNSFTSLEQYHAWLKGVGELPEGFRVGTAALKFFPKERPVGAPLPMNLTLLVLDRPTKSFAARFTRNLFPGAPVLIGRRRLKEEAVSGILVNNKISNVCAPDGEAAAEEVLAALGKELGLPGTSFFPASTGIIGWGLPKREMIEALPEAVKALHGGSCLDAARAIMTTDAFPKIRSRKVGQGSIVAFAKGAGMIEPNLATMLVFILTDIALPRAVLQACLARATETSFNCISVDSDQSTSDTVLLLSSERKPAVPEAAFEKALAEVCLDLARDIVRNGEGTAHVLKVRVAGASSYDLARNLGKAVVNSPLVKTAVYGCDPNVGRILSALGDWAGNQGLPQDYFKTAEVSLGGEAIFRDGAFQLDKEKEGRLSAYLKKTAMDPKEKTYPPHDLTVDIEVVLRGGGSEATVFGSDLSYEYVKENADYRS